MYKYPILLLLLTGTMLLASGQSSSTQAIFPSLDSLESVTIQPASLPAQVQRLPFHRLLLVDNRFDTSKVGYLKTGRHYKKLVTEMPFAARLQTFLNNKYDSLTDQTSALTLLIVVKDFWLQQASAAEQKKNKMAKASEATTEFANCTARFDVYMMMGDSYVPILKWDSIYNENRFLKKCVEELMIRPFDDCISKIARMNFSKIAEVKLKLTWKEIAQYNNQRLAFPRFKSQLPGKGIYKTFQDFLQNKPLQKDFIIQYGSQTDEVFVIENGTPVLLTDFWGLCDGEKNYLKVGFNLFELVKQNNTYDLWGSKLTVDYAFRYQASGSTPATAILGAVLLNNNRVENTYKPLQLNMETGEVY
jgi:hypothetical protein